MSNDENEFLEQLYNEMADYLLKLANMKLHDIHSSQDAVQETFVAAQKNIQDVMQSPNPQGWLVKTLRFKALKEQTVKVRFTMLYQKLMYAYPAGQPDNRGSDGEIFELLEKIEYALLKSIYIDGYSIKEAADILNIPYETCKKRAQTAKRKLAQEIK